MEGETEERESMLIAIPRIITLSFLIFLIFFNNKYGGILSWKNWKDFSA